MEQITVVDAMAGSLGQTQQAALAAMRAGQSFAGAAETAGVGRATVYRWVQNDPQFRAAYNTWQAELATSARGRLLKLAERAVDVVEKALEKGDKWVAVEMLRSMGVLREPKLGRTDAETLKTEMDLRERRERLSDVQDMTRFLLEKAGFTPADQQTYVRNHGYDGVAQQLAAQGREMAARNVAAARDAAESNPIPPAARAAATEATSVSEEAGKARRTGFDETTHETVDLVSHAFHEEVESQNWVGHAVA